MDPRAYVCAHLERRYLDEHPELTPAARELVHAEVLARPAKYAASPHDQALLAYMEAHERLMAGLAGMDDLSDEEFDERRAQLFSEARQVLARIAQGDQLCVDARLVSILLADVPLDSALADLLKLEDEIRGHLTGAVAGFDLNAPGYWDAADLARRGITAAERTISEPACIGWLRNQVALIRPKIIVCLGRIAAQKIIREDFRVTKEHGIFYERKGCYLMGTYHPAALLRNPAQKADALCDFIALREKISEVFGGTTDNGLYSV